MNFDIWFVQKYFEEISRKTLDFSGLLSYNIIDGHSRGGETVNVQNMRVAIARAYPHSDSWQAKVRAMPDDQVIAVYYSFVRRHKI